jgi:CubicO group peptidase (beta-lactamase class C family)
MGTRTRRISHFEHLLRAALILAAAALPADASELPAAVAGPRFRADGPNAEVYGRSEGYPSCKGLAFVREDRCKVGALSHFDRLFPARSVAASQAPTTFRRAAIEPVVRYTFAGEERTLEQYLERRPVTGFLIARGDTILVERYQYERTDRHRLASFSLVKTIIGLLVGIAIEEGTIRSIDDLAQAYVPALRGTAYGQTPIKALLQMRSGVRFREDYADQASDIYTLARLSLEQDPGGSIDAIKRFDFRLTAPGTRFLDRRRQGARTRLRVLQRRPPGLGTRWPHARPPRCVGRTRHRPAALACGLLSELGGDGIRASLRLSRVGFPGFEAVHALGLPRPGRPRRS